MKKRLWNCGILIGIIILLAIGIPRIIINEARFLSSPEEEKKVEQLEKKLRQWSLRPIDKLMVQGYEAKPNGHYWDTERQKSVKNYRITYYTFFGIRYAEGEISGAGGSLNFPALPLS